MAQSAFTVTGSGSGGTQVPLASLTASNSPTLEFTNLFNSNYYQYLFYFNQLIPSTNNVILQCQFGTGGGPTYITANYNWTLNAQIGGSNFVEFNASDSSVTLSQNAGTYGLNSTNACYSGEAIISGPNGLSSPALANFNTGYITATTPFACSVTGTWFQPAAVFTAIKFFMSSGNIASGTIDVYGIIPA